MHKPRKSLATWSGMNRCLSVSSPPSSFQTAPEASWKNPAATSASPITPAQSGGCVFPPTPQNSSSRIPARLRSAAREKYRQQHTDHRQHQRVSHNPEVRNSHVPGNWTKRREQAQRPTQRHGPTNRILQPPAARDGRRKQHSQPEEKIPRQLLDRQRQSRPLPSSSKRSLPRKLRRPFGFSAPHHGKRRKMHAACKCGKNSDERERREGVRLALRRRIGVHRGHQDDQRDSDRDYQVFKNRQATVYLLQRAQVRRPRHHSNKSRTHVNHDDHHHSNRRVQCTPPVR